MSIYNICICVCGLMHGNHAEWLASSGPSSAAGPSCGDTRLGLARPSMWELWRLSGGEKLS